VEFGEVDTVSLALRRIPLAGRLVRPRLKKSTHLRDEGHQARELTKTPKVPVTVPVGPVPIMTA